ncbi:MAG TPA: tRNA pseudouridine(55) synthase TruB [Synergistales bacterium]|jgi:tRNA pseudouridine55 synthase/riboflavin kinase/FMN adenylyltransferase|nr:tRNA pseudouridine(55) synthase TruB [Synergistales bacterium]MDY0178694.1 tRNA pseudouridine(55) synthase TruB [Synergistaceae bacterium]NLV64327.1 tRNA pseudouridine(55) synthase TruB [Synergistaceae bacterium]HOI81006.1 tRNA pseudouridine(55) synthase TruB [Synergistales bacterium]HPE92079.1 tRNA pseudouridine(55) synthase TruB [Synergistales bacterium]
MRSGFLVIDKAPGTRSTQCTNLVKRILGGSVRVGHAGTLDSTASGILVLLVGRATRASRFVMMLPKTYLVTARLGSSTDTDDLSGQVIALGDAGKADEAGIDRALLSFSGLRDQVPPSFSAVKVKGRRAHSMARRGFDVRLEARPVLVTSIRRAGPLEGDLEVPLGITCHQGTYVRSIVRDLGAALGCGAVVSSLTRTSLGPFILPDGIPSDDLAAMNAHSLQERILPLSVISSSFTTFTAHPPEEDLILSGRPVPFERLERRGWGAYPGEGLVVITGRRVLSFARIEAGKGRTMGRPVTNILLEG